MQRRFLILLCCLFAATVSLTAQKEVSDDPFVSEEPLPAEPWRKQLDQLTARLGLTPEQRPAAEALLSEYYAELQANPSATAEEKRSRKRAFRKRFQQLLTPDQQQTLRAGNGGGSQRQAAPPKRGWLDVLIDDVATPLLDNRRRNRRKGG